VDENRRYVPWSYVISPDGKWLARSTSHPDGGSRGLHLEFFDLDTGKPIHKMPIDFRINALVFSANGKWLATSDDQGKADQTRITVYEVPSGKQLQQWGMQGSSFGRLLGFSPDGPSLYIGESKGTVAVWDAAGGRQTAVFKAALPCTVHRLAFTSKGKVHALGMDWTAVRYWDVESGKSLWPTRVPVSTICNLAFSPTGDLFVATEDGDMGWWNPRTAVKLRDVKLESTAADATYPLRITLGTDVVAINAAKFFDAGTGKLLFKSGYVGYPRDVHFIDGGKKAAALQSGKLRAWDSRSGRELWSVDLPLGHGEWENKLAVTSTGNYFAVGLADHAAGRVLLWDSTQKKFVREWAARSMVDAVSFSADARWLAFADRDRVRLIRVGAGTGERQFTAAKDDPWSREEFWINQMAFSPDGRQLAQAAFPLHGPLRDAEVTNLRVFEVASGKLRLVLPGHPFFWPGSFAFGGPLGGSIRTLAYSPDSTLLVSGATDATALVWNAGLRAFAATPDAKLADDADLANRFEGMTSTDAKAAFQNMIALAKTPKQTIKLLDAKILPAKTPDSGDKTVPQWIEDIGSNQFAIRSKASAMLQTIGPSVEAELRAALPKAKDVESKRRIEAVLGHFAARAWTQEDVSHARAVEILEAIGTPDAHALLARWSAGDAGAVLTQEAAKTLKRVR